MALHVLKRYDVSVWFGEDRDDAAVDGLPARTFSFRAPSEREALGWAEGACWDVIEAHPGLFYRAVAVEVADA